MKSKSAKPFVKWAGGKYKLANDLKKLIHKKFDIIIANILSSTLIQLSTIFKNLKK